MSFMREPLQSHLHLMQYSNAYFNPYEVKHRKRTTRAQLTLLEATFADTPKPTSAMKRALATQLEMPFRAVQVWFQNRRAKEKHVAAKMRLKAEAVADDDEEEDDGDQLSPPLAAPAATTTDESSSSEPSSTASSASNSSLLAPPAVNFNRRGSAPSLGLSADPSFISPASIPDLRHSPLANKRVVSDSICQAHHTALTGTATLPVPDASSIGPLDEVPNANALARRRSLPTFHPDMQQYVHRASASHKHSLPTISDLSGPGLPGESCPEESLTPPSATSPVVQGNAYRYGLRAQDGLKYGAAPYPLRGPMGYAYRSGSMPGTGVFRIPVNPNGPGASSASPWPTGSGTEVEDTGAEKNFGLAIGIRHNQPFAFPQAPRRVVPDLPATGPLPRADFSFGASDDVGLQSSLPTPAGEEDGLLDEATRLGMMSHRFGSLASTYSIESDATGVSAATTTSSVFTQPTTYPTTNQRMRGGWTGFGGQNSYDSAGPPITYGQTDYPASLSAGPVRFPNNFNPDMRRASCPAHFVEQFASFGVEGAAPPIPTQWNPNGFGGIPSGHIRKRSSGFLAKSPLGMNIQVNNQRRPSIIGTAVEEAEPPTAMAGNYPPQQQAGTPQTLSVAHSPVSPVTGLSSRNHSRHPTQSPINPVGIGRSQSIDQPQLQVQTHAQDQIQPQLAHSTSVTPENLEFGPASGLSTNPSDSSLLSSQESVVAGDYYLSPTAPLSAATSTGDVHSAVYNGVPGWNQSVLVNSNTHLPLSDQQFVGTGVMDMLISPTTSFHSYCSPPQDPNSHGFSNFNSTVDIAGLDVAATYQFDNYDQTHTQVQSTHQTSQGYREPRVYEQQQQHQYTLSEEQQLPNPHYAQPFNIHEPIPLLPATTTSAYVGTLDTMAPL